MAKIREYSNVETINDDDLFLIETSAGTKTVKGSIIKKLAGDVDRLPGGGGGSLGKVVIFGDSLSSGFNGTTNKNEPESGYNRWSSYLTNAEEVRNFAVGGSCFGSGYAPSDSVPNMASENMIVSHQSDIAWADMIIIGYGGNDVNAVNSGKTTPDNVINKAISCVASIKAINSEARLVYAYIDINTFFNTDTTAITKAHLVDALSYILYCHHVEIARIAYGSYLTSSDIQSDNVHPNATGIAKIGKAMNRTLCHPSSWTPSNRVRLYFGDPLGTVNPLGYKFPYIGLLASYGMEITLILDHEGTVFYATQSFVNTTGKIATWVNQSYVSGSKLTRFSFYITENGGGVTSLGDA